MKNIYMLLAAMLLMVITSCGGGGSDPIPAPSSSAKAITAFSLAGVAGTINETGKTIAVSMPFGTSVSALVATFTTTGSSVKVGSTVQVSGTTANNFTSPVTYTVTAADASTQDYTVTVTVAASSAKAITAFSLNGVVGTINETGKTIAVTVPSGTSVTALVATFTTTGASVKVGSTVQISGTTANNFTSPVTYTVTAADATTQDYTVTVTVAASSAKAITAFSLAGVVGTINETGKTIAVSMPFGTDVTALVATFTTTGASVKVGSTVQISGTTAHNFTAPVVYTVTAADATTQDYTVTVTVAASSAKAITAFSLNGVVGTINETGKTIAVTVPSGTSVTALVATFTTTGASVKVGSTVQISGTTANNFTSPVTYTVTAADASTQDYTVTVTVDSANTWTQKADILAGSGGWYMRRAEAVGFSIGSKGYIGTGRSDLNPYTYKDFWEYDPVADTWTQKADVGSTPRSGAVGFSIGSKGYIGTGSNTRDFWEYDPAANTWTQKADVGGTIRSYAVGFSIGSKGYIGTGSNNNNLVTYGSYENDIWEYDPAANTWTQKANVGGAGRRFAVGFSIGTKGYVGTGQSSSGMQKDFWEYDPAANTWTQKADFGSTPRSGAVGFSIGSKGYVGTGNSSTAEKGFWEYDPAANTWTQKADFGGAGRWTAVGFSIENKGYIGTGTQYNFSSWTYYVDLWEYDPGL